MIHLIVLVVLLVLVCEEFTLPSGVRRNRDLAPVTRGQNHSSVVKDSPLPSR